MREAFQLVNDHRYDDLMKAMTPKVKHNFAGDHALGGERNDKDTLHRWFERLGRVFPNLRLDVTDTRIIGWPHNTLAIVQWLATSTLKNGDSYTNKGVHFIRLKWGKIISLNVYEDSQAVALALQKQASAGIEEAVAEKIESD